MKPRIAGILALAWLTIAATATAAEAEAVPLRRVALGELGGWIELEVSAGGQAGRWLLDTGASRNFVSPTLARRLDLEPGRSVRAELPLGQTQGREVQLPALRIGDIERTGQDALVVDLASIFGEAGSGIDGVVGVPLLEGLLLDLDLIAWSSRWLPAGAQECPAGMTAVPLRRHRSLPVVDLDAGATHAAYLLDTGNPAGLIRVEPDTPTAATPGLVIPGDMRLTVLHEIRLGPQRRSNVPVVRLTSAPLHRLFDGVVWGLAGTAFLDGARWRLDLAAGRLCVEDRRVATPGGLGLVLQRQPAGLVVSQVLPGSPAERAGLRVGDPVHRWAGLPPARPLRELWQAVQGHEEVELTAGAPPRAVTLRRAIFAPLAGP